MNILPGEQSVSRWKDQLASPAQASRLSACDKCEVPRLDTPGLSAQSTATEQVVIERAADPRSNGHNPGDGVADHVRLGLADQSTPPGVDDILQDTGTDVVAGEYKHARLRGISGSSAFAFSRPKELKESSLCPYLFILRHGRPDRRGSVASISVPCSAFRGREELRRRGWSPLQISERTDHLHIGTAASGASENAQGGKPAQRKYPHRASRLCPRYMICPTSIRGPSHPRERKGEWVNGSTCSSISISALLSHARV